MKNRKIINPSKLKFTPFNNYGKPIPGMRWHKISYNRNTGVGSYILKMAPGARSLKHKHQNYKEFYILDGQLTDEDNTTFNKDDFISYKAGSKHSSFSKKRTFIISIFKKKKTNLYKWCGQRDLNSHGLSPHGPQPCLSTNFSMTACYCASD